MIKSRSEAIWGKDYDPVTACRNYIPVPYPLVMGLAEKMRYPALAVLSELCREAYLLKKKTFPYTSERLNKDIKRRGLFLLERERWITVERKQGKAPLVTLRWKNFHPSFKEGYSHHLRERIEEERV